jgi:hypothetical protein
LRRFAERCITEHNRSPLLPNLNALEGRVGAARFFEAFESRGTVEVKLRTIEIEDLGQTAWERGSAEQSRADGSVIGRSGRAEASAACSISCF